VKVNPPGGAVSTTEESVIEGRRYVVRRNGSRAEREVNWALSQQEALKFWIVGESVLGVDTIPAY
jgi:hypothetical protein